MSSAGRCAPYYRGSVIDRRGTFDVEIDAASAWQVVGDIADAASWVPGVVAARFDGQTRVCTTADGGEIRERISDRSDRDMSYRYEHLATPAPIRDGHGTLGVRPNGAGCRVDWDAEFTPGRAAIARFFATVPADGRLDRIELIITRANGQPCLAAYLADADAGAGAGPRPPGRPQPYGVMVLTIASGEITAITGFPDPALFPAFGLIPPESG